MAELQTGDTYAVGGYGRELFVAEPKQGKTVTLMASLLGLLPWQKHGAIVDKPENLYVFGFDTAALAGIKPFLKMSCEAPDSALKFKVINMEGDAAKASATEADYDMEFYNTLTMHLRQMRDRADKAKGTSAVLFSSTSGMSAALERSIMGPPKGRGYGDPDKWKQLSHQITQIQMMAQAGNWHVLWEGHIEKKASFQMSGGDSNAEEKMAGMSGSAGKMFPYNVARVYRLRRIPGQKYNGTKVDQAYLDTQPSLDFVTGGRGFNELLNAKEPCLTTVFTKLGLKTGNWKAGKGG